VPPIEALQRQAKAHEIGEMPAPTQAKLLRVLEDHKVRRLGSKVETPVDVRVLAATNKNPEQAVADGQLRRDLYFRLNVFHIHLPPLREHKEDLQPLVERLLAEISEKHGKTVSSVGVDVMEMFKSYPWPGNVGELKNLVQRVLILGAGEEIRLEEIERELAVKMAVDEPLVKQDLLALPLREAREQFERAYLQQQLLLCNGKVGQLAKRVGMERTHLYRKLRALGVDFRQLGED